jgi:hypothetical protein
VCAIVHAAQSFRVHIVYRIQTNMFEFSATLCRHAP